MKAISALAIVAGLWAGSDAAAAPAAKTVQVKTRCHVAGGPRLERCQVLEAPGLPAESWTHAAELIAATPACALAPNLPAGQDVEGTFPLPMPLPADPPHVITQPDWLEKPSADLLSEYYPPRVESMSYGGEASVECVLDKAGKAHDCRVLAERPGGLDFGRAAINIATHMKFKPMLKDCQPVDGGKIRIPVHFPHWK